MARSRTPSVNAIQASGPRMMTTRQQKQRRDHPTSLHALRKLSRLAGAERHGGLLRVDASCPDHRPPALDLGFDETAQEFRVGAVRARCNGSEVSEPGL